MSLKGILDFQRPIKAEGLEFYYPYEGGDTFFVLPDKLTLATDNSGKADFKLELVRGQNPFLPPKPYGVLDYTLQIGFPTEQGLSMLRSVNPVGRLAPAQCTEGFLRMQAIGIFDELPEDFQNPFPITWNTLGASRFIARVSIDTITLFKRALLNQLLSIEAIIECEIRGVAPRLPLIARFDPFELLTALHSLSDQPGLVSREAILSYFRKPLNLLPLTLEGPQEQVIAEELASTLTDWVRVRFGKFIPSPEKTIGSFVQLTKPEEVGTGNFQWDLSQAIEVPRVVILHLDPLSAGRNLVAEHGIDSIVTETVVPAMQTGNISVLVTVNLPDHWPNILSLGVTIQVPPKPPFRVQAIHHTVELQPGQKYENVLLQLSPAEPAEYQFQTFVVVRDTQGIERLEGELSWHSGLKLDLTVDDFPVTFVLMEANRQLLELSTIQIHVNRTLENITEQFTLTLQQPSIAVALPKNASEASIEVEAFSITTNKTLKLGPFSLQSLMLGLHSFAEFGVHRITFYYEFTEEEKLIAIELLPEDKEETFENISIIHFTPDHPVKEWSYLASSPFKAGYRYRIRGQTENNPWSEIQSAFSPLHIQSINSSADMQTKAL